MTCFVGFFLLHNVPILSVVFILWVSRTKSSSPKGIETSMLYTCCSKSAQFCKVNLFTPTPVSLSPMVSLSCPCMFWWCSVPSMELRFRFVVRLSWRALPACHLSTMTCIVLFAAFTPRLWSTDAMTNSGILWRNRWCSDHYFDVSAHSMKHNLSYTWQHTLSQDLRKCFSSPVWWTKKRFSLFFLIILLKERDLLRRSDDAESIDRVSAAFNLLVQQYCGWLVGWVRLNACIWGELSWTGCDPVWRCTIGGCAEGVWKIGGSPHSCNCLQWQQFCSQSVGTHSEWDNICRTPSQDNRYVWKWLFCSTVVKDC